MDMSTAKWEYPISLISGAALLLGLSILILTGPRSTPSRTRLIRPSEERVLIIGASSGVGRATAVAYAKRGALIAIVARRSALLEEVKRECIEELHGLGFTERKDAFLAVTGDFSNEEDMERVREVVKQGIC